MQPPQRPDEFNKNFFDTLNKKRYGTTGEDDKKLPGFMKGELGMQSNLQNKNYGLGSSEHKDILSRPWGGKETFGETFKPTENKQFNLSPINSSPAGRTFGDGINNQPRFSSLGFGSQINQGIPQHGFGSPNQPMRTPEGINLPSGLRASQSADMTKQIPPAHPYASTSTGLGSFQSTAPLTTTPINNQLNGLDASKPFNFSHLSSSTQTHSPFALPSPPTGIMQKGTKRAEFMALTLPRETPVGGNLELMHITCMNEYEKFPIDEIRNEDYDLGRKPTYKRADIFSGSRDLGNKWRIPGSLQPPVSIPNPPGMAGSNAGSDNSRFPFDQSSLFNQSRENLPVRPSFQGNLSISRPGVSQTVPASSTNTIGFPGNQSESNGPMPQDLATPSFLQAQSPTQSTVNFPNFNQASAAVQPISSGQPTSLSRSSFLGQPFQSQQQVPPVGQQIQSPFQSQQQVPSPFQSQQQAQSPFQSQQQAQFPFQQFPPVRQEAPQQQTQSIFQQFPPAGQQTQPPWTSQASFVQNPTAAVQSVQNPNDDPYCIKDIKFEKLEEPKVLLGLKVPRPLFNNSSLDSSPDIEVSKRPWESKEIDRAIKFTEPHDLPQVSNLVIEFKGLGKIIYSEPVDSEVINLFNIKTKVIYDKELREFKFTDEPGKGLNRRGSVYLENIYPIGETRRKFEYRLVRESREGKAFVRYDNEKGVYVYERDKLEKYSN